MKWRAISLGAVMRAVAFKGWRLRKGEHHLVLTSPKGDDFDYRIRPSSMRKSVGWWNR